MSKKNNNKEIGLRIQSLRETFDLQQAELADKININRSVLNRIENGTRPLRDDEIKKIADFFEVSADYLLGRKHSEKVELDNKDTVMTYQGKVIPKEDLEVIRRFLRGGKSE
ncbi:MAG: helix-turn-helix domain-containing protein [Liquorilactobacillus nagelii]|jgi:transcriptional regulator with XRE-family HTH domain|uniref:helix-turn-helix domain-containing protein n=1 Tax=Liquorilactobacillus nagelii TaxID=82688 RepID=UPI00242C36C0|nr:helix-turn-helix transcriptional regulator [Liquorilactobacillus nagelii]MCI1921936.1 helix-turn-helix domain-containing protein [Liquorilactobacillus nagelii]MCI1976416.1 helix-turn-helix domain-containing protein [Liquorilactobacillus nagelii]